MKKLTIRIFIPLLFLLLSCRTSTDDAEVVRLSKDHYTAKDAAKIGDEIKNALHEYYIYNDILLDTIENIEAYDYISRLLKTLTQTSNVANRGIFHWSITILKSDEEFEMYTTPGGHIFITTGLLKFISSESQLLMMMAHEICYPDKLILMEKLKKEFGGVALGSVFSRFKDNKSLEMGLFLKDLVLSTEETTLADEYAISLVCPFRYDTEGLQNVLQSAGNAQLKWLVNRPSTSNRVNNLISKSILCGSKDRQFPERYNYFKNYLLPK